MKKVFLFILAALMISGAAQAQSPEREFRMYKGKITQRSIPEALELMVVESEEAAPELIVYEKNKAAYTVKMSASGIFELSDGRKLKLSQPEVAIKQKKLIASLVDDSGAPTGEGSAILDLEYTQWGIHNANQDD